MPKAAVVFVRYVDALNYRVGRVAMYLFFVMGAILPFALPRLAEFAILLVATVAGCWAFYLAGRSIGWARPLIGLRAVPRSRVALA